jgi:hypothetical protein
VAAVAVQQGLFHLHFKMAAQAVLAVAAHLMQLLAALLVLAAQEIRHQQAQAKVAMAELQ